MKSVLSFHLYVRSGTQTQVARLACKLLDLLRHVASPEFANFSHVTPALWRSQSMSGNHWIQDGEEMGRIFSPEGRIWLQHTLWL